MNKQTVIVALVAIGVVAAIVSGGLFATRHNKLELRGNVLKVRTHPVEQETVAIVDFRASNPSTNQFVVKEVEVSLERKDGKIITSENFSEQDAQRLFTYFPVLGQKFNATLMMRDKINPGQSIDRMIAVKFPVPESEVQDRKALRIQVADVDGSKALITETVAEKP